MGIVEKYEEIPLINSRYFNSCWLLVDGKLNGSEHYSMTDFWIPTPYSIIAAVIIASISIVGPILNALVIICLLRNSEIRKGYLTPSIVSIALTDFLYSVISCPVFSMVLIVRDMALPNGCQAYSMFIYWLWMCSALNLLCIAILRVMIVQYPRKTKKAKFQLACKILPVIAWSISFLWLFPTLIGKYGQFGLDCKALTCRFINEDSNGSISHPERTYGFGIIIIGLFIFLLNLLTYIKITTQYREIRKHVSTAEDKRAKEILEKERRLGKMVTLIIASFFIVYFPLVFLRIADPDIMTKSPKTYMIFAIFGSSIGIIDPLVYIVFNEEYRTEVKSLVNDTISLVFPRKMYPDA